jgi:hypothetical protein
MQGTTWQHITPPKQFGGMPPAGGTYHQYTTMAMLVCQLGQAMMNYVGQKPSGARPVPMMQMMQPSQQLTEMPMMAP